MIRAVVPVRRPFHVYRIVDQAQRAALVFRQSVELDDFFARPVIRVGHAAVAAAVDVNLRVVDVGAGRLADQVGRGRVRPVGQVDGVKPLNEIRSAADDFLGGDNQVNDVGRRVDDWSSGDADGGRNIGRVDVAAGHGNDRGGPQRVVHVAAGVAGSQEAALPEYVAAADVGVDGIEGVVFGGDEDDVVDAGRPAGRVDAVGDGHAGIHQRLGVNLAVHRRGEQLPKRPRLHIGRRQLHFRGVDARTRQIVVIGQNVGRETQPRLQRFDQRPNGPFNWLPFWIFPRRAPNCWHCHASHSKSEVIG